MEHLQIEKQYANALGYILENGIENENRTGTNAISVPYVSLCQKNDDGHFMFPEVRGKKVYPFMALKELLWMLKGRTDLEWLRDHNVTYWDEWELPDGTIGKSYGWQYRNFNGVDQVDALIKGLRDNPLDRRHIISLWNPSDLNEMALPPCQFLYEFIVQEVKKTDQELTRSMKRASSVKHVYKVHLSATMRSADMFLGVPYNMMFNGWMLALIVDYLNHMASFEEQYDEFFPSSDYLAGDIYMSLNNAHVYVNHVDQVKQYIANVSEDKDRVVSNGVRLAIDHDYFNKSEMAFDSFDSYLDWIIDDVERSKRRNIRLIKQEDSYGKIEAPIAV